VAGVCEEGARIALRLVDPAHVVLPKPGYLARQTRVLKGGMHHVRPDPVPAWIAAI